MALTKVCHGCLSVDRLLSPVGGYEELYKKLLLKKTRTNIKSLMICWECFQTLNNIHTFGMKITKAQELLRNKNLSQQDCLSQLSVSKKLNDYQMIVYEDKIDIAPINTEAIQDIKQEKEFEIPVKIEMDAEQYVKEELDDTNDYDDNHKSDLKEEDEVLSPIDTLEKKTDKKVKPKQKKRLGKKYKTIILEDMNRSDKRKFYDVVKVDMDTIKQIIEKRREKTSKKNFQCDRCYLGFTQQKTYERHLATRHSQKKEYECDFCGFRFPDMLQLTRHINEHFRQFVCKLCGVQLSDRTKVYLHFNHGPHRKLLECKRCGARFDCNKSKEFFDHYQTMHGYVVCDYCGQRCLKKSWLAHHIRIRHTKNRCVQCDIAFHTYHALTRHNRRKHVVYTSERNYCVECNLQFDNSTLYAEHITRSVKHVSKPRIPCPDCEKTYTRRSYMMNHYNLEHLKQSKNVCSTCDKSFLNGWRLRVHIKSVHEKVPNPRKFTCSYCHKGFTTRCILNNHVRTHTGERPFKCARCPSAFAQKTALKTHEKSAHK